MAAIMLLALFGATLLGYANSGKTQLRERSPRVSDGVNVNVDLVSIDPERHVITVRATPFPAGSYLDAEDNSFTVPLRITSLTPKESVVYEIEADQAVAAPTISIFP